MIFKLNNKSENFYNYMGKIFGSRLIERQINDRIYDDENKEWYLYKEDEKIVAFISTTSNIIKNIYTMKPVYLEQLLLELKKDIKISPSIVTNLYIDIYKKCGIKVNERQGYKNFVEIYTID